MAAVADPTHRDRVGNSTAAGVDSDQVPAERVPAPIHRRRRRILELLRLARTLGGGTKCSPTSRRRAQRTHRGAKALIKNIKRIGTASNLRDHRLRLVPRAEAIAHSIRHPDSRVTTFGCAEPKQVNI